MITIEEIVARIYEVTSESFNDFISEDDFNNQISEIRANYMAALEKVKIKYGNKKLEDYNNNKLDISKSREINFIINDTYKRTNSLFENLIWDYKSPLNFNKLSVFAEEYKEKFQVCWEVIHNAERYLNSEISGDINSYYINILDCNHQLFKKNYTNYDLEGIILMIYLISTRRIIKLLINKDRLMTSSEHIIQKDFKKVEIYNDVQVCFHYHGLHDPDVLFMDNYESAVSLRKIISELREFKSK